MINFNNLKSDIYIYGASNFVKWKLQNPKTTRLDWFKFRCQYFKEQYENGKMIEAHDAWFKQMSGRSINFNNLNSLSEKLQWIKLFENDPRKKKLADKLESKQWASNMIGSKYIIDVLEQWESPKDINFINMPKDYVLKFSHGSGMNFFIFDGRAHINGQWRSIDKQKDLLSYFFGVDYAFYSCYEMQYHQLKPVLFAERQIPLDTSLKYTFDYKFWCFNGCPILFNCYENNSIAELVFSTDLKYQVTKEGLIKNTDTKHFPKNFDKLLQLSSKLSEGFNFARVDFFVIENKIYFGEITFTPNSGLINFNLEELDQELAKKIIVENTTLKQ